MTSLELLIGTSFPIDELVGKKNICFRVLNLSYLQNSNGNKGVTIGKKRKIFSNGNKGVG